MRTGRSITVTLAFVAALALGTAQGFAQPPIFGPEVWSQIDLGFGPRYGHTMTYDPVGDRVILFGGARAILGTVHLGDLWEMSLGPDPTWRPLIAQGTPPPPRSARTAVYDAAGQRILIHGGHGEQIDEDGDVWVLSLAGTPTWTHLTPGGTLPGNYHQHSAIYDPVGQRMIVYGGWMTTNSPGEVRILSMSGTRVAGADPVPDRRAVGLRRGRAR